MNNLPISGGAVVRQDDDAITCTNDQKRDFDDGGGEGEEHNVNANLPISGGAVVRQGDDAITCTNDPKRDFDDGGGEGEEHFSNSNLLIIKTQRKLPAKESDYKRVAPSINKDYPRYIDRPHTMGKIGNAKIGTDAAHILSRGLINSVVTHSPGQPRSDQSKATTAKKLNDESNLRIKPFYVDRELDERRDARIAQAVLNDTASSQETTIRRAEQAYNSSKIIEEFNSITQALVDNDLAKLAKFDITKPSPRKPIVKEGKAVAQSGSSLSCKDI